MGRQLTLQEVIADCEREQDTGAYRKESSRKKGKKKVLREEYKGNELV